MCPDDLRALRIGDELTQAARKMQGLIGPSVRLNAVVLFGSRARGDALESSDVDIALISEDFRPDEPMLRRLERVDAVRAAFSGLDPVCLSPAEMARLDHILVLDVLHEGVPLLDDGTFQRLKVLFQEALQAGRIAPFPGGWDHRPEV